MLDLIRPLYESFGMNANNGDVYGLIALFLVLLPTIYQALRGAGEKLPTPEKKREKTTAPQAQKEEGPSWSDRLSQGLSKSRQEVWGRITAVLTGQSIGEEHIDQIEEILYGADLGPELVGSILTELQEKLGLQGEVDVEELKRVIFQFLFERLEGVQKDRVDPLSPSQGKGPKVIMIVGVNGAGKTTTIGKLATKLTQQGHKVVVGACDTFRAAAVDQLQVWCERAGATMIRAREGANPSGVGYDALQTAMNEKADFCILDTAGRLHTKGHLMEELKKSKNVLQKLDPTAPHEVLLVLDAITGQNALRQAEEFHQYLDLTGLIFTKCDGSSKAGSALAIGPKLGLPITYIGVGESVEDLDKFDSLAYLEALLDYKVENPRNAH